MYQSSANTLSDSDERFIASFESASLPGGSFRHRDHVRLAWLYLRRYPLIEAVDRYRSGLKRFAAAQGAPEKYHETITWAYLLLIHQRLATGGSDVDWDDFVHANPDLLSWPDHPLDRYYRKETLASELARRVFLLPDRGVALDSETGGP